MENEEQVTQTSSPLIASSPVLAPSSSSSPPLSSTPSPTLPSPPWPMEVAGSPSLFSESSSPALLLPTLLSSSSSPFSSMSSSTSVSLPTSPLASSKGQSVQSCEPEDKAQPTVASGCDASIKGKRKIDEDEKQSSDNVCSGRRRMAVDVGVLETPLGFQKDCEKDEEREGIEKDEDDDEKELSNISDFLKDAWYNEVETKSFSSSIFPLTSTASSSSISFAGSVLSQFPSREREGPIEVEKGILTSDDSDGIEKNDVGKRGGEDDTKNEDIDSRISAFDDSSRTEDDLHLAGSEKLGCVDDGMEEGKGLDDSEDCNRIMEGSNMNEYSEENHGNDNFLSNDEGDFSACSHNYDFFVGVKDEIENINGCNDDNSSDKNISTPKNKKRCGNKNSSNYNSNFKKDENGEIVLSSDAQVYARRANALPRLPGVCYDSHRLIWRAFWTEKSRRIMKYFSVAKYGFEQSRKMAVEARKEASLRLPCIRKKPNRVSSYAVLGTGVRKKKTIDDYVEEAEGLEQIDGVSVDVAAHSWVVNLMNHITGGRVKRVFAIRRYGFLQARQRALECRYRWLRRWGMVGSEEKPEKLKDEEMGFHEHETEELPTKDAFDADGAQNGGELHSCTGLSDRKYSKSYHHQHHNSHRHHRRRRRHRKKNCEDDEGEIDDAASIFAGVDGEYEYGPKAKRGIVGECLIHPRSKSRKMMRKSSMDAKSSPRPTPSTTANTCISWDDGRVNASSSSALDRLYAVDGDYQQVQIEQWLSSFVAEHESREHDTSSPSVLLVSDHMLQIGEIAEKIARSLPPLPTRPPAPSSPHVGASFSPFSILNSPPSLPALSPLAVQVPESVSQYPSPDTFPHPSPDTFPHPSPNMLPSPATSPLPPQATLPSVSLPPADLLLLEAVALGDLIMNATNSANIPATELPSPSDLSQAPPSASPQSPRQGGADFSLSVMAQLEKHSMDEAEENLMSSSSPLFSLAENESQSTSELSTSTMLPIPLSGLLPTPPSSNSSFPSTSSVPTESSLGKSEYDCLIASNSLIPSILEMDESTPSRKIDSFPTKEFSHDVTISTPTSYADSPSLASNPTTTTSVESNLNSDLCIPLLIDTVVAAEAAMRDDLSVDSHTENTLGGVDSSVGGNNERTEGDGRKRKRCSTSHPDQSLSSTKSSPVSSPAASAPSSSDRSPRESIEAHKLLKLGTFGDEDAVEGGSRLTPLLSVPLSSGSSRVTASLPSPLSFDLPSSLGHSLRPTVQQSLKIEAQSSLDNAVAEFFADFLAKESVDRRENPLLSLSIASQSLPSMDSNSRHRSNGLDPESSSDGYCTKSEIIPDACENDTSNCGRGDSSSSTSCADYALDSEKTEKDIRGDPAVVNKRDDAGNDGVAKERTGADFSSVPIPAASSFPPPDLKSKPSAEESPSPSVATSSTSTSPYLASSHLPLISSQLLSPKSAASPLSINSPGSNAFSPNILADPSPLHLLPEFFTQSPPYGSKLVEASPVSSPSSVGSIVSPPASLPGQSASANLPPQNLAALSTSSIVSPIKIEEINQVGVLESLLSTPFHRWSDANPDV